MEELIDAMTNEDTAQRPSIDEVIERFTVIQRSLRSTKLRSALTSRKVPRILSVFRQARQCLLTIRYTILQRRGRLGLTIYVSYPRTHAQQRADICIMLRAQVGTPVSVS